ncbi:MAG: DUF1269 domain-containing protein [Gemmatimonadaceae bacterium]|nr:DUF1269 domain-containing protein [Gemmatimonadaceae bacterium]
MTAPSGPASTKRIIVASFPTSEGAGGGLDRLKAAGARLGNAAVIRRMADGQVEFKETQDWGIGKSAAVGAVAALLLPGIGPFAGAIVGGLAAHFVDAGFPDPLLKQMGSGIGVGTSMLVALVESADIAHAERTLTDGGATILGSGLESDLSAAISAIGKANG